MNMLKMSKRNIIKIASNIKIFVNYDVLEFIEKIEEYLEQKGPQLIKKK